MEKELNIVKNIFRIAYIYGILALLPQYFLETKNGIDFPPAITHSEYYYGFIGVALAWQFVFYIISKDPIRYRTIIYPALFEKASFGVPCIYLYVQGRLSSTMLLAGCLDLVLMILFIYSLKKIPIE